MLTSTLVRVRYVRHQVGPCYLVAGDPAWREVAKRLIDMFRGCLGRTRGELEEDIDEIFGDAPTKQIHRGLAKLLEDRCEFAVAPGHAPDEVRAAVFRAATQQRQQRSRSTMPEPLTPLQEATLQASSTMPHFDRAAVLEQVARELGGEPLAIERALFADLRGEQQLVSFKEMSAERLLQRYNVALAQAVLLRAASVEVLIRNEPPPRYRQLLRLIKFYRLMCEVEPVAEGVYKLRLDGPLSLFVSTQKYGLQLALFLPAILLCKDFELEASVRWGPGRTDKKFQLSDRDGLVSHYADQGTYVPPELEMFAEMFRKKITNWDITAATELLPLGETIWAPDFQLLHRDTGQVVYLDVLGFWRRASARQHLERLRRHAPAAFVLAVSDQLHVEEGELEGLPTEVYRFRQMPLADEVARLASEVIGLQRG